MEVLSGWRKVHVTPWHTVILLLLLRLALTASPLVLLHSLWSKAPIRVGLPVIVISNTM